MRRLSALCLLLFAAALFGQAPAQAQFNGCQPGLCNLAATTTNSPLVLNFAGNSTSGGCASFSACLTTTRASSETCTDASGNVTYATSGNPCITSAGLQLWGAATNLIFYSVNPAQWVASSGTLTGNAAVSPDGTTTANKTIEGANCGPCETFVNPFATISAGTTITISGWLQAGVGTNSRYVRFSFGTSGRQDGFYQDVDLVGGTLIAGTGLQFATGQGTWGTAGAGDLFIGSTIQAGPGGWYRVSVTGRVSTLATSATFEDVSLTSTLNQNYTGDSSSYTLFWGMQVEQASFASPYIPTNGATASRSADNISASGALATALAVSTGTVVAHTNGALQSTAATIVDANGTVLLGKTSGNAGTTAVGATLSTGNTGTWTGANDLGLAFDGSGGRIQLNGGTVATDTTARTPAGTFHLGSTSGSSAFLSGNIASLSVYPTKLTSPQ